MAKRSLQTNKINNGKKPKEPKKKTNNPIRDYLRKLVWDGVPRLANKDIWPEASKEHVFAGTVSEIEFLPDTTGHRRFWPVRVNRVT